MPDDLSLYRERARAHERTLDVSMRFLTVQQLAERWGVAETTVRAIPFDALPWTPAGRGAKRHHRRYDPADVLAYELARRDEARRASA